jgi:hypothetical protein
VSCMVLWVDVTKKNKNSLEVVLAMTTRETRFLVDTI